MFLAAFHRHRESRHPSTRRGSAHEPAALSDISAPGASHSDSASPPSLFLPRHREQSRSHRRHEHPAPRTSIIAPKTSDRSSGICRKIDTSLPFSLSAKERRSAVPARDLMSETMLRAVFNDGCDRKSSTTGTENEGVGNANALVCCAPSSARKFFDPQIFCGDCRFGFQAVGSERTSQSHRLTGTVIAPMIGAPVRSHRWLELVPHNLRIPAVCRREEYSSRII